MLLEANADVNIETNVGVVHIYSIHVHTSSTKGKEICVHGFYFNRTIEQLSTWPVIMDMLRWQWLS